MVKVLAVSAGSLLGSAAEGGPSLTQSIDESGVCLISISALNGKTTIKGSGSLIYVEVEAVGAGDASLVFDKDTLHFVATDARDVVSQVKQGTATVKQ